jgi:hypothetical protein
LIIQISTSFTALRQKKSSKNCWNVQCFVDEKMHGYCLNLAKY